MINSKLFLTLSVVPLGILTLFKGYDVVASYSGETIATVPLTEPVSESDLVSRRLAAEQTTDAIALMESALTQFNKVTISDPGEVPADRFDNVATFGVFSRGISDVWQVYAKEADPIENAAELDDLIKEYLRLAFPTPPLTQAEEDEFGDFVAGRVTILERKKESLVWLEKQSLILDAAEAAWKTKDYKKAQSTFENVEIVVFEQAQSDRITAEELVQYKEGCIYYLELDLQLKELVKIEEGLRLVELQQLDRGIAGLERFIATYSQPPAICDDTGHTTIEKAILSLGEMQSLLSRPFVKKLEQLPGWCNQITIDLTSFKRTSPDYVVLVNDRILEKLHEDIQSFFNAIQIVPIKGLDDWRVIYTVDDKRILISSKFNKALKSVEPRLTPKPPQELYHEGKSRLIPLAIGFAKLERAALPAGDRELVDKVLGPHGLETKLPLIKIYDDVASIQERLGNNEQIDFEVWNSVQADAEEQLSFIRSYNEIGGGVPEQITQWLADVNTTLDNLQSNENQIKQVLDLLK